MFDVNATDDDVMSNGEVKYAIMHGDEGKFIIDTISGIITTAGALDRETKDSYTVTIINCTKNMLRLSGLFSFCPVFYFNIYSNQYKMKEIK